MSSSPFKFQFQQASDIGKVRQKNDDYTLAKPEIGLFIVCDGVGGNKAGDVASRMAAEITARHIQETLQRAGGKLSPQQAEACVAASIREASAEIYEKSNRDPKLQGMCTTLEVLWLRGAHAIIGHVGDSRIYQFRGGRLFQLTEDHTYERQLLKEGRSPEEARNHIWAKHVCRIVGDNPYLEPDTLSLELMPNDRFLICSDGINKMIDDSELELMLTHPAPPDVLTQDAIAQANQRGGKDNSSLIILDILENRAAGQSEAPTTPSASLKLETLKEIPFFKGLNYTEINKVLSITDYVLKQPGETLVAEGDDAQEYWVLLTGKVDILEKTRSGETVKVSVRRAGMGFGESALFKNARRTASVVANTVVEALVMDRQKFFDLARKDPSLAFRITLPITAALFAKIDDLSSQLAEAKSEKHEPSSRRKAA